MKAVVYNGARDVRVEDVPEPRIEEPTDAIVRITSSGICGSDLHMYDGHTPAEPGIILGHEPMGVVEEVGDGVSIIKEGDRVVMPFNVACGTCYNCLRGYSSACLVMNPQGAGAAYGYVTMGPYRGAQAEMLRVPRADWACLKLPGRPGDDKEDAYVMLADVFPTAFHATEMARVSSGKTVAVFGAGPVGLLSAYCSMLKGASEVYVVDRSPSRLRLAERIGAVPVNFEEGDPAQQIIELRKQGDVAGSKLHPTEKWDGVECGIDAVGYQAYDREKPDDYRPDQVITDLVNVVNPAGNLGIIGVYMPNDPRARNEQEANGLLTIPFGLLWSKGLSIETGQAPVKNSQSLLRDLIVGGKARPSFIVSDRIDIDEAPDAYASFDKRDDVTKAIIRLE
ncbi:MAG TPA: glutathione-independent formaldehyde dehydrogenase [Methanomassiliicoccaceae archaeon]|jgi:glutathione-independent formaldehyde dehydrogenase|nr:glutathione-independent formaldehyde dehydrogenase [Methanomassiliicoccaceae archaeon]HQD87416.1 glutathione-independent formaldehyde dehydrogenase [Methanomassiliicoccaceae archaeon]